MLGPILCGLLAQAPLLANLRGQFAEFLNNASPARLRILSSPTCVGLRYGYLTLDSGFSRQCGISLLRYLFSLPITPSKQPAYLTTQLSTSLGRALPAARSDLSSCVPTSLKRVIGSTGISTCCPSTTPFGLALGPDLPWADEPSPGNLSFRRQRFSLYSRYLFRHSHY